MYVSVLRTIETREAGARNVLYVSSTEAAFGPSSSNRLGLRYRLQTVPVAPHTPNCLACQRR